MYVLNISSCSRLNTRSIKTRHNAYQNRFIIWGWAISWLSSVEFCSIDKSIYSRWGFAPESVILVSAKVLSAQKSDVIFGWLWSSSHTKWVFLEWKYFQRWPRWAVTSFVEISEGFCFCAGCVLKNLFFPLNWRFLFKNDHLFFNWVVFSLFYLLFFHLCSFPFISLPASWPFFFFKPSKWKRAVEKNIYEKKETKWWQRKNQKSISKGAMGKKKNELKCQNNTDHI